jgi:putative DNA primase/helicase
VNEGNAFPVQRYMETQRVFPLAPGGKGPLLPNWNWKKNASSDHAQIEKWARQYPGCNWGGILGEGLVVVEIDPQHGGSLEAALSLGISLELRPGLNVVGSGYGYHIPFTAPVGTKGRENIVSGISLRGADQYSVLPPSVHKKSGRRYEQIFVSELSPCPPSILNGSTVGVSAKVKYEGPAKAVAKDDPRAPEWLWEQAGKLTTLPKGKRNQADLSFGNTLRNRGFDEGEVLWFLETYSVAERGRYREDNYLRRQTVPKVFDGKAPQEEPEASKSERLIVRTLADVSPRAPQYLWKPRIPLSALALVVGMGGEGKSTMNYSLVASATQGKLQGDLSGATSVIILTAEDTAEEIVRPRLEVMEADLDRVHLVTKREQQGTEGLLVLPLDVAALGEQIRGLDARLVVVDPAVAFMDQKYDTHRDAEVRKVLAPMAKMAEQLRCAVVAVVHFNKAEGMKTVLNRVGGSAGFVNAARSVLFVGPDPEDPTGDTKILAHAKANWSRKAESLRFALVEREIQFEGEAIPALAVEWLGEAQGIGAGDVLAAYGTASRDEAARFLRSFLADGAMPASAVLSAAAERGIAERTLHRAKKELSVASIQERQPGGQAARWMWELGNVVGGQDAP